jgi:hypothetical protein
MRGIGRVTGKISAFVSPRRSGALAAYPALTLAFAILAHVSAEALGSTGGLHTLASPVHVSLAVAALAAVGWAAIAFGFHRPPAERRRRLALLAAAVDRRPGPLRLGLDVALQAVVAGGTLAIEGVSFDPARIAPALLGAVAALVFGALVLRAARAGAPRIAAFFAQHAPAIGPRPPACDWNFAPPALPARARHYALFIPNRPPPRWSLVRP